jgi:hypothetical protein
MPIKYKRQLTHIAQKLRMFFAFLTVFLALTPVIPAFAASAPYPNCTTTGTSKPCCGSGDSQTQTSIDIGCQGKGNAITDATFAIIRFLTNGVGVVLVASMVYAGIQYSSARGEPGVTAQAIARIRSNVVALLLFIFAYALLNYIIPGQVFHS